MNKKLLNRIALSLALLIPASYLNAVCPCKFKNNAPQVPVGYKAPQAEVKAPVKAEVTTKAEEATTEEVSQDPFASCETGSCPIIWDTEELAVEFTQADLEELTQEEVKQKKPAKSSLVKKVAAVAGVTAGVAATAVGVAYVALSNIPAEELY